MLVLRKKNVMTNEIAGFGALNLFLLLILSELLISMCNSYLKTRFLYINRSTLAISTHVRQINK